jgi:hypothetical protein
MAKQKKSNAQSGRYITLYHDLLNSPAYRALSASAKTLLVDMRLSYNGSNNGNISAVFAELKHRGWRSPATLSKSLYELRSLGFIALTKEGGLKQGTRVCSLYRFTDLPVLDIPKHCIQATKATYDYRGYKTLSEAMLALAQGCSKLKADGVKKQSEKKSPVQKKAVIASKNVLDVEFSGSKNEQRTFSSLQNMYSALSH